MARVLLVEDDAWMADCYRQWLNAGGYEVQIARDAQGAIDCIDAVPPDLIMLDLLLPYANGVQLLHTLQSYSDLANIPIILCSSALPDDLPDLTAYGVRRTVTKASLTPNGLCEEIKRVLANAAI